MDEAQICESIVSWLKERQRVSNTNGALVGLSGGIDSAVTAVLCQRAFGSNLLCLIMPCGSTSRDLEDAQLVAGTFNLRTRVIQLDKPYESLKQVLGSDWLGVEVGERKTLADANLKPRLRMMTLYYYANLLNYLVVGTGNRSELEVGYFTKYGDGGVDLLPLGGLLKTQVRKLAKFLGIPQTIIDKAPSAGLWLGQTDEEELGLSYAELDQYLMTGCASNGVAEKVNWLRKRSEHKRSMPPIPEL